MRHRKLITVLAVSGVIIFLLHLVDANEYLIKGIQRSVLNIDYPVNDQLSIVTPPGWMLEYSFEGGDKALLYGFFEFDWDSGLQSKIQMAVSFTTLGPEDEEFFIYKLKEKHKLSESVFNKGIEVQLANGLVGYKIEIEDHEESPFYFPSENLMVYSDSIDIIPKFLYTPTPK